MGEGSDFRGLVSNCQCGRDNQCVDRHGAVIIATCNIGIGQLDADGLTVKLYYYTNNYI